MNEERIRRVYETMACHVIEGYRMPGVDDAFADDAYCMIQYRAARDAYDRLLLRLGEEDEDKDIEAIIQAFMNIQQELCFRMYRYGAQFGLEETL